MRVLAERQLAATLGALTGASRVVVGALNFPGEKAIIALPSWHPKADVSTVVPMLHGPVTSFQHSFDHVAHPSVRESLREAGRSLGLRF